MTWKVYTLVLLLITRVTTDSLICLTENTLDTVNNSEEVIGFAAYLPLCLLLHNLFIDYFEGEFQIVNDVVLDNEVKRHFLTKFTYLLRNPLV